LRGVNRCSYLKQGFSVSYIWHFGSDKLLHGSELPGRMFCEQTTAVDALDDSVWLQLVSY
jgi:hypothetical protein